MYKFPNLEGVKQCDDAVQKELSDAGITVLALPRPIDDEVRTNIIGLGLRRAEVAFVFNRVWHYWIVKGLVPLSVAEELYNDHGDVGREEVRVGGDPSCRPPKTWVRYYGPTGKRLVLRSGDEIIDGLVQANPKAILVKDPTEGIAMVDTYHIDSPEGLKLFVQIMRRHILMA